MILRAAWVVPVTAPPIRDGAVQMRADRIVAVGPYGALRTSGDSVFDLGAAVLVPGLVNPHTHLELTGYAGMIPPGPFWPWIMKLTKLRAAPGQIEREQRGVHEGAWQSLRAGVTCVGDISRRNLDWPVLKPIPIRKVCYVELLSVADEPPRTPDELRVGVDEVQEDPLLTVGVTPHAPYTVPGDQIRAALLLAAARQRPWCTHWAETPEECAFVRGGTAQLPLFLRVLLTQCGVRAPLCPPIEYLEQCARGVPPGALAHYNYPEPGDAARLAAAGHVVMYCPRAHRFFGHAPHPYHEMLAAGVTVALGTDSSAGNENLCLLEEARYLRRETPDPPPAERLLRMITLDAARALGLHAQIGSLEPGKFADLAAFPCPPTSTNPVGDLIDQAPAPTAVWVAGQRVI